MSPQLATLVRLTFRRLRWRTLWWSLAVLVTGAATVSSYDKLYPTLPERQSIDAVSRANASFRALLGVPGDLTTSGGFAAWKYGMVMAIFAALFGLLTMSLLTRGDEESGRRELVWSAVVNRKAPLLVSLLATWVSSLVLGLAVTIGMYLGGAPGTGAWLLGAATAGVAIVFASVGALASQFSESRRGTSALAGIVLAVSYGIRMAADAMPNPPAWRWLSPLTWFEEVGAYGTDRVGPLLVSLVVAVAVGAVAVMLESRRDLGAAMLRMDRASGRSRWIHSPEALTVRLHLSSSIGWAVGIGVAALAVGAIANQVADFGNVGGPRTAELIEKFGGSANMVNAYLAGTYNFLGLLVVVLAVQGVLFARREEASARVDLLLSLPVRRPRWLADHWLVALVSAAVAALVAGLAGGIAWAATSSASATALIPAGLNMLPAAVLFGGLAMALVGYLPRWSAGVAITVPVLLFLWDYVGRLASMSDSLLSLSPFHYVAPVPAQPADITAAIVMCAAGLILAGIGLMGIRSRDLVPA